MIMKSTIAIALLLVGASVYAQLGNDRSKLPPEPAEKIAAGKQVREAIDRGAALAKIPGKLDEGIRALKDALELSKAFDKRYSGFSSRAARELAKALIRAKRDDEALAAFREGFRWHPEQRDLIQAGFFLSDIGDYALLLLTAGKSEEAKAMYYYALRQWGHASDANFPLVVVFEADDTMTVWEDNPEKLRSAILMLRAINSGDIDGRDVRKERIEEVQKREPTWIVPIFYANQNFGAAWFSQAAGMASDKHEKEWVALYEQVLPLSKTEQRTAVREVRNRLGSIAIERRKNSQALKQAKLDMERMHSRVAAPAPGQE